MAASNLDAAKFSGGPKHGAAYLGPPKLLVDNEALRAVTTNTDNSNM